MSVENKMHVKTERNIYGNKIGQIFRVLIVSANICINKFECDNNILLLILKYRFYLFVYFIIIIIYSWILIEYD